MSVANPLCSNDLQAAQSSDLAVVIFARAPVAGRCKTRLARGVGHARAARLYRAMLEHVVASVAAAAAGPVLLTCAPDTRHPLFARLARRYGVLCRSQARGDLGRRMAAGIRLGLEYADRVVLMGSDQPNFEGRWLEEAERALIGDSARAWLAPTLDGGYWAIGLNCYEPRVFRGPRWATPRVARTTRAAFDRLGLAHAQIEPRRDIDEPRDWQKLEPRLRAAISRRATIPGLRF